MIRWCQDFSRSTEIVLPKESFRSKRIHNAICHAQYNLNYKSESDISTEDGYGAHKLAYLFLEKSREEGKKRLYQLKKLHHKEQIQINYLLYLSGAFAFSERLNFEKSLIAFF